MKPLIVRVTDGKRRRTQADSMGQKEPKQSPYPVCVCEFEDPSAAVAQGNMYLFPNVVWIKNSSGAHELNEIEEKIQFLWAQWISMNRNHLPALFGSV